MLDRFGAAYQPYVLSIFRFIMGLLLFQYGVAKIFKFPALAYFANPPPLIMTAGGGPLSVDAALRKPARSRHSADAQYHGAAE